MLKDLASRKFEIFILALIILTTTLVYIGHFDNPFFFDDTHTISTNESIRSLENWTDFFTDANTFSSLPANRAYRPMITLMNAVDYSIADGLNPRYFHYHIFFWFLVLIILVFFLSKHIYHKSLPNKWIGITALFATAWFAFHTANAETINYICARSDSFSTLCIVASLLLYLHPFSRKWFLYLITMTIGIWTKQTGVMFFPILLVYIILFEEHSLLTSFKTETKNKIVTVLRKITPAGILACSLFIFNQYYLTPKSTDSVNVFVTRFEYISTQWYVIMHYLSNFILPINLSADPDITIIKPWYNFKILSGLIIILGMFFIMIKTSLKKELRPIAFGIAWFFIALLPTSITPLFQIANDHRMFFPFIGLFIAIPWGAFILLKKYIIFSNRKRALFFIIPIMSILLAVHAYGTTQRNEVWNSQESLWHDVTQKSPKNGRGLMNYGLTFMNKGDYDTALEYFHSAYKLTPNYSVVHINLGIAYSGKKDHLKAEEYFNSALKLNKTSPDPEYFYARYLYSQKKHLKAKNLLQKALIKSPNHTRSRRLLNSINKNGKSIDRDIKILEDKIKKQPKPDLYIELSLKLYKKGEYKSVISVCRDLLKIEPKNAAAYNNICSAYNQLKKWKLGAEACKKALEINPDFQLAKNNLKWATDNIKK